MSRNLSILLLLATLLAGFLLMRSSTQSGGGEDNSSDELANMPADFRDWRVFVSKSDNFKIFFPGLPQHATDKISDPLTKELRKYDTYVAADSEGPAIMVNIITFPKNVDKASGLEKILKTVVDEMQQRNKDNQLRSLDFGDFKGYKALDFSLNNGELLVKGKVIAYDNKLFVLSMVGHQDTFNPKVLEFFIDSFQITENNKENGSKDK